MGKKLLLIAILVNLGFIGAYMYMNPRTVAAENQDSKKKQEQSPKSQQQDNQAQKTTQAPDTAQSAQTPQAQQVQQKPQGSQEQLEVIRQREEFLRVREAELKVLEEQIKEKIKKLEALENSIKTEVDSYKQMNNERIKYLVKIYSSMKPKAAATLMNDLDIDLAVEVLMNMKGEMVGGILSAMDGKKAATITQKLVTFRSKQKNVAEETKKEGN